LILLALKRLASGVQLPPWPPKSPIFSKLRLVVNPIHLADWVINRWSSIFVILCVRWG